MKKNIKYPILVGGLRGSTKELINVNNVQMSILESVILNMEIGTKKVIRPMLKSIRR